MATSLAPGMLKSARLNPSRTCMAAVLPRRRISRCNPSPLPRASPSGLRWEVIRKLRPLRMRSATSRAALSGLVIFLDIAQQLLDAPGAGQGFVVTKVELWSEAQSDPLSEKMPDLALQCIQVARDLLGLLFVHPRDEHTREVKVRTDVHARDGDHRQAVVLQVVAKDLHQGAAECLAD